MATTFKKVTGNFAEEEGTYHFHVIEIDENPVDKDGAPIDGIKVECDILDGTNPTQKNKQFNPIFRNPSPAHKDGGDFFAKKLTRLAEALGILPEPDEEGNVTVDWSRGKHGQFVAKLHLETYKEKTRLNIDGDKIYSVDDPSVAGVPKNPEAIDLYTKYREKAGLPPLKPLVANSGNGKPTAPAASRKSPEPPKTTEVDLSDI